MEVKDDKLSSRILLNMATCHWQINEFGPARKAASRALEFTIAEDKGRAKDIVDACDRELRRVASTKDGVDHAAAGDAALHAKDSRPVPNISPHFVRPSRVPVERTRSTPWPT